MREDERGARKGRMLRHLCKCSMFYRVFFAIAYFEYPIPDHHFLSDLISIPPLGGCVAEAAAARGRPTFFPPLLFVLCSYNATPTKNPSPRKEGKKKVNIDFRILTLHARRTNNRIGRFRSTNVISEYLSVSRQRIRPSIKRAYTSREMQGGNRVR